MYCESCGNFVPDGQAFCANCGAPAAAAQRAAAPVTQAAPAAAQPVVQQTQPVQQAQPVVQQTQPVYQQPVYQQPVVQPVVQPVYQQPVYTTPAPTVIVQQPAVAAQPQAKPEPKRGNGPATAGLTFGILTFLFSFTSYFVSLFALLGLIFSIVGLCKKNAPGKGKAVAGLILTVLGVIGAFIFALVIWPLILGAIGMGIDSLVEDFEDEFSFDEDVFYDTSYSDSGLDNDSYYISGDFANTDKGYVCGVLHIDGFIVEF
ncbi:MAG: PepSY-associated TM helix domain-containing protein [Saccharofermentans sp.]|nr:PepSY-associated TM helix domain-containing protein [Saccharofermentans sp.]